MTTYLNTLKNKKLFLLDMDGTIYLDKTLFDGTIDFLNYVKEIGGKYLFLTNNSSKSVNAYIDKLKFMGINSDKNDFLTSTDAMILFLKSKGLTNKKLYAFGTASFKEQLSDAGFNITDVLSDDIDCLVTGFDTELTFKKLEDACILLNRGVDFYATNPDWVCPTWYGFVPDCGSVCEMLYRATGRKPVVIGKPQPEMALIAIKNSSFTANQTILIGDRIYTDIACGVNAGIDTILVLSGETSSEEAEKSDIKPSYVIDNIREILNILKS